MQCTTSQFKNLFALILSQTDLILLQTNILNSPFSSIISISHQYSKDMEGTSSKITTRFWSLVSLRKIPERKQQQLRWIRCKRRPDLNAALRVKAANISHSTLTLKIIPFPCFPVLSFFKMSASCILFYFKFLVEKKCLLIVVLYLHIEVPAKSQLIYTEYKCPSPVFNEHLIHENVEGVSCTQPGSIEPIAATSHIQNHLY